MRHADHGRAVLVVASSAGTQCFTSQDPGPRSVCFSEIVTPGSTRIGADPRSWASGSRPWPYVPALCASRAVAIAARASSIWHSGTSLTAPRANISWLLKANAMSLISANVRGQAASMGMFAIGLDSVGSGRLRTHDRAIYTGNDMNFKIQSFVARALAVVPFCVSVNPFESLGQARSACVSMVSCRLEWGPAQV